MDQLANMHKAPRPAHGLTGLRLALLLAVLMFLFFIFSPLNNQPLLLGDEFLGVLLLVFLYLVRVCWLSSRFKSIILDITAAVLRGIGSFIMDTIIAVSNGKYISIDVSTLTDAQEVIVGLFEGQAIDRLPNGQGSAGDDVALETIPGAFETSDDDRTALDSDSEALEVQAELTGSSADGQTCVGVDSEDALPVQSETIDAPADQQASVEVGEEEAGGLKSETLETPADDADSRTEAKAGVDVEYKSSEQCGVVKELETPSSRLSKAIVSRRSELSEGRFSSVQIDTTAQRASSDGVVSPSIRKATVASTVCKRTTARNVAGVQRRRRARVSHLKKEVGRDGLRQARADEQAVADNVVGLLGDVPASNGHASVKLILRNGSKKQGSKTRRPIRSQIARRHSHRRELLGPYKARMSLLKVTLRSLGTTKNRILRVLSGVRRGVGAESRVEFEGRMTGLVFDTPEQAMIGSDSEAEMEIDDETPTVGDDKVLAGDPMDLGEDSQEGEDPMDFGEDSPEGTGYSVDVSQDGPRSETADTGNSSSASATANGNSMAPTRDGQSSYAREASLSGSAYVNQERNPGKVNKEKLQERLAALRQTSTNAANSVATGSYSDAALAQSTQEHATPVSKSEAGKIDLYSGSDAASAQATQEHATPVSTPEASKTAPSALEGVAQPFDSTHSAKDLREARRGKKPEAKIVPEEVSVSNPSPEEPMVDGAVQPASPRVSPSPASTPVSTSLPAGTATEQADTSDTTSSSAITPTSTLPSSTPSTAPTSPQTTPARTSESSSARSATTADSVARKRKVVKRRSDDRKSRHNPGQGKPDQVQDDQDTPATSSKRSQRKRPEKAKGDQEAQFAAPMTQTEINDQILEAQFDTQPGSDTDFDWPTDEDEGVETRGRGGRRGKSGKGEGGAKGEGSANGGGKGSAKAQSNPTKKDKKRKGD